MKVLIIECDCGAEHRYQVRDNATIERPPKAAGVLANIFRLCHEKHGGVVTMKIEPSTTGKEGRV